MRSWRGAVWKVLLVVQMMLAASAQAEGRGTELEIIVNGSATSRGVITLKFRERFGADEILSLEIKVEKGRKAESVAVALSKSLNKNKTFRVNYIASRASGTKVAIHKVRESAADLALEISENLVSQTVTVREGVVTKKWEFFSSKAVAGFLVILSVAVLAVWAIRYVLRRNRAK